MAVDEESVAATPIGLMADPEAEVWLPGFVTDTTLVIVQSNVRVPVKPAESVAVRVTA